METEDKIRKLMRSFDVRCPACGSDCVSVERETDTDVGIMDELVCECENVFYFISSINSFCAPVNVSELST